MQNPNAKPLRSIESLRAQDLERPFENLSHPAQVLRVLEDATMWFSLGKPHIWQQRMDSRPNLMKDAIKVAWEAREINPEIADLLRWTEANGQKEPSAEKIDLLTSLWTAAVQESIQFREMTASRWPEDLAIASLQDPPRFKRAELAPAEGEPRYPSVRAAVTESDTRFAYIFDLVLWSLWKAGVTENDLQNFISEAVAGGEKNIAKVAGQYMQISFEGTTDARTTLLKKLGRDKLDWPTLLIVPKGEIESYRKAAEESYMTYVLTVDGSLMAAARMDAEIIFIPSSAAKAEDLPLILNILERMGSVVGIEADFAFISELKASIAPLKVPVLDIGQ